MMEVDIETGFWRWDTIFWAGKEGMNSWLGKNMKKGIKQEWICYSWKVLVIFWKPSWYEHLERQANYSKCMAELVGKQRAPHVLWIKREQKSKVVSTWDKWWFPQEGCQSPCPKAWGFNIHMEWGWELVSSEVGSWVRPLHKASSFEELHPQWLSGRRKLLLSLLWTLKLFRIFTLPVWWRLTSLPLNIFLHIQSTGADNCFLFSMTFSQPLHIFLLCSWCLARHILGGGEL